MRACQHTLAVVLEITAWQVVTATAQTATRFLAQQLGGCRSIVLHATAPLRKITLQNIALFTKCSASHAKQNVLATVVFDALPTGVPGTTRLWRARRDGPVHDSAGPTGEHRAVACESCSTPRIAILASSQGCTALSFNVIAKGCESTGLGLTGRWRAAVGPRSTTCVHRDWTN